MAQKLSDFNFLEEHSNMLDLCCLSDAKYMYFLK